MSSVWGLEKNRNTPLDSLCTLYFALCTPPFVSISRGATFDHIVPFDVSHMRKAPCSGPLSAARAPRFSNYGLPRANNLSFKRNYASSGGGGGIRTPGELPHNGFQDRRLQPLGHSSANPAGFDDPRKFLCIGVSGYGGIGVYTDTPLLRHTVTSLPGNLNIPGNDFKSSHV